MGASSRLSRKVEESWRGREKQKEEKEEEKQLREEKMREENIRIYRSTAIGFVSMKPTWERERADPWDATPTWQKALGGVGLETGQCWGMACATAGQGLSEPQPAPSQHSQQELKAGILQGRVWPQVLYLISVWREKCEPAPAHHS